MVGTTRRARTLDALALAWVALWVVVAVALGSAAWGLGDVTDAARQAASGTDQAGRAVEELGDLPLVPDRVGTLGGSIRDSAGRLDDQALAARTSIHRLAVGLAGSVFAVATAPVWLVHLPLRARRARAVASLRALLAPAPAVRPGDRVGPRGRPREAEVDPDDGRQRQAAASAYLAHRAVVHLPPQRLLAITADPAGDLAAGRHDALARAELARLGLDPRALGPVVADPVPPPPPPPVPWSDARLDHRAASRTVPHDDRDDTSWDA